MVGAAINIFGSLFVELGTIVYIVTVMSKLLYSIVVHCILYSINLSLAKISIIIIFVYSRFIAHPFSLIPLFTPWIFHLDNHPPIQHLRMG